MNKKLTIFMALFALTLGVAHAEFDDVVIKDGVTVGEILQVCKDVASALSEYTGIELCEALKKPYSVLQRIDMDDKFSGNCVSNELLRLKCHLELLTDSWRLERVSPEPCLEAMAEERDTYWGFTLKQTKRLASIQAELVSALISYHEVIFTVVLDEQEKFQRESAFVEIVLKRAEYAITYLKALMVTKKASFESKDLRIRYNEIDEQEFFLGIEETIEEFNHFLNGRYHSQETKALYEDRIRGVLQELEALYAPCVQK